MPGSLLWLRTQQATETAASLALLLCTYGESAAALTLRVSSHLHKYLLSTALASLPVSEQELPARAKLPVLNVS